MGADGSFYVKYIAIYAPAFLGYNNSVLARVKRCQSGPIQFKYRKVASSNTSHLEAHEAFSILLMKGIFDPYILWPFDYKLIS